MALRKPPTVLMYMRKRNARPGNKKINTALLGSEHLSTLSVVSLSSDRISCSNSGQPFECSNAFIVSLNRVELHDATRCCFKDGFFAEFSALINR